MEHRLPQRYGKAIIMRTSLDVAEKSCGLPSPEVVIARRLVSMPHSCPRLPDHCDVITPPNRVRVVYYEWMKRELKIRPIYGAMKD